MNTFTIYDLATGQIEYSTTTVAEINEVGLQDNQGIIEGNYQSNEFIIVDGEAVVRTDNILEILRLKRDALLTESDWTQVNDSPLTDAKKTEWATYRQSLRDVPITNASITNIDDAVWPTKPQWGNIRLWKIQALTNLLVIKNLTNTKIFVVVSIHQ